MNSKHMMQYVACAAAFCGSVQAHGDPLEGVEFERKDYITAEAGLSFDSKFLSYGLVDNNDPILTPSASATLFDWLQFGVESIFDVTAYGRKHQNGESIYGNRQFRYQELDPSVAIVHEFSPENYPFLPTTIEFSLGYMYEYHPRSIATGSDDTQFVTLELAMSELPLEPAFAIERDIVRDNGTYASIELGHTFELSETVTLRPSVAQGLGNTQRVRGYLARPDGEPLDRGGMMDTFSQLALTWQPAEWVELSAYAGYSDYLFDSHMRDAARHYEASGDWERSWNFVGGFGVKLIF